MPEQDLSALSPKVLEQMNPKIGGSKHQPMHHRNRYRINTQPEVPKEESLRQQKIL